eukprot:5324568-Prymnesium_polylepis.1
MTRRVRCGVARTRAAHLSYTSVAHVFSFGPLCGGCAFSYDLSMILERVRAVDRRFNASRGGVRAPPCQSMAAAKREVCGEARRRATCVEVSVWWGRRRRRTWRRR